VARVFDIPDDYQNNKFLFYDAKKGTDGIKKPVAEGESFSLTFEPFEIKVFNAVLK
jgi:hypothetical protein